MRRLLVVLGGTVLLGLSVSGPASARVLEDGGLAGSAVLADTAEAWFTVVPEQVCTSPLGCPAAPAEPPSPFPADTLQLGALGGQETHRVYLRPDLSSLPAGAVLTGGSVVLPLADQASGTAVLDPPALSACLVTAPFTDGTEGTFALPKTDCSVHTPAALTAEGGAIVADIAVLAAAWAAGAPNFGVAFVPTTATPGATWHVAGNGKDRAGLEPTAKVSWRVQYVVVAEGEPPPVIELPPVVPEVVAPPVVPFGPPPPAATPAATPAPVVPTRTQVRNAGAVALPWFTNDGIVFVPLVLLVGCGLLLRLLTQPVPPLTSPRKQP